MLSFIYIDDTRIIPGCKLEILIIASKSDISDAFWCDLGLPPIVTLGEDYDEEERGCI
jgi:hypothetical protein